MILIILATVAINAAFGENGLIKSAEKAKDLATNSTKYEEESMANLAEYMNELLGEETDGTKPKPPAYIDGEVAEAPTVTEGMTPVKWNGSSWVKTTADKDWYNYAEKKWANVVLGDATFNEDTLDESKAYSMLVWIPRYAYQITSGYHQSGAEINPSDGTLGAGNINVVFVDKNNQDKNKTKTYNEEYPSYTTGNGMSDYVVHPAFNYGGTKLAGIWVGKYETRH